MPRHLLVLEKRPDAGQWPCVWDEQSIALLAPDGRLVFRHPANRLHRIVSEFELLIHAKIEFRTKTGPLKFRRDPRALADLRAAILRSMAGDPPYLARQRRIGRTAVAGGLGVAVLFGLLFAAFLLYAARASDPPPDSWMHSVLPWVKRSVLYLTAAPIVGLVVAWCGWLQLHRLRSVVA